VLVSYHPTREEIEAAHGRPVPVGAGQLPPASVVVAEWNDREQVETVFATHAGEISAVICEPLLANSGCIPPAPGFLEFLREITRQEEALLIFDEVITGFRLDLRGAQGFYGVTPDLATYGKAVGGGVSFSVLAGKARYMELISAGTVVHAGTLNGNPLSLAAAKAALQALSRMAVRCTPTCGVAPGNCAGAWNGCSNPKATAWSQTEKVRCSTLRSWSAQPATTGNCWQPIRRCTAILRLRFWTKACSCCPTADGISPPPTATRTSTRRWPPPSGR